jgi:hypothetical protein
MHRRRWWIRFAHPPYVLGVSVVLDLFLMGGNADRRRCFDIAEALCRNAERFRTTD